MNTENPQNLAGAIAPIDSATRLPRTTEEDRHQEHFKTDHLLPNLRQRTISSGLVTAAAPAVAWFYREPRLVGITLVLSITFVLASSAVQHIALLNRQMRFKVIAVIDILSMLAGYLTGIGMALSKYGYWALVGASVTQVAIKLVLTWSISRWWPRSPSRNTQTWHLLRFGANITAGSLMYEFARSEER